MFRGKKERKKREEKKSTGNIIVILYLSLIGSLKCLQYFKVDETEMSF